MLSECDTERARAMCFEHYPNPIDICYNQFVSNLIQFRQEFLLTDKGINAIQFLQCVLHRILAKRNAVVTES